MIRDPELAGLADAVLIPPFPGRTPPAWILAALEGGLAGITLFGPNVADPEQIALLTATLRSAAEEPVIAIDEEGGDVTRVTYWSGSLYPGNAALGAIDDVELTGRVHEAIGADLAALGINVDLAPCVDVLDEAENPAIGTRSFGADPALVSRHAAAAVTGLQSAGVAACAKHFPGHGSTRTDTHEVLAAITGDVAELRRRDLPPFQAAIGAGVAAVMPGHLRLPELTGDLPASLSAAAVTGLLRGELGFTGVIISDALEMRAVSGPFGIPEAAVLAVTAGVDLLCLGRDTSEDMYHAVVAALAGAVRAGRLPGRRLEDAADRVAGLRAWLAAARASAGASRRDTAELDGEHIGLRAARRAVRRYGQAPRLTDPVIVEVEPRGNVAVGRAAWGLARWAPPGGVRRISAAPLAVVTVDTAGTGSGPGEEAGTGSGPGKEAGTATAHAGLAEAYADGAPAEAGTAAEILAAAANRSLVLVVRDAHRSESTRDLVLSVLAHRPDAVVVEMGLPVWRPPAGSYRTFVATYGASRVNGQAAAEVLGLISRLTGGQAAALGLLGQSPALLQGQAPHLGRQPPDCVTAHEVKAADVDDRSAGTGLVRPATILVAAHEREAGDLHLDGVGHVDGRAAHDRVHVHGEAVGVDLGVAQVNLVPAHDRQNVHHRGRAEPAAPLGAAHDRDEPAGRLARRRRTGRRRRPSG
jgi:beta-N-acetylhexosaminidase